jgi:formylglycine-generating enzyme required for sulfatase activity
MRQATARNSGGRIERRNGPTKDLLLRVITYLVPTLLVVGLAKAQNSPTPYCTAGISTNGCMPSMLANVQPNTTNDAGCLIVTTRVEGLRQGIVFYGVDNTGFSPVPWGAGSTSFRCVKTPTMRVGTPQNSGGVAGECNGVLVVDWDAFQSANPNSLGNPWTAGEKVFLQSWYRDPLAVNTSNLSNALELTLRSITSVPALVAIPPGTFQMGSNAGCGLPYFECGNGQPAHDVTISYGFWMGQYEVTQDEYVALMGSNPATFSGGNKPVDSVSSHQALSYCAALTAQQAALGNVPPGYQYRLPTEAEWEYACRAGTTTEYSFGSALFCNQAWFGYSIHSSSGCGGAQGPAPVGSYAPNAWGLYDMHGNLWEWCLDGYETYAPGAVTDPFVSGGTYRVFRGGGWSYNSSFCRSAYRSYNVPGFGNPYTGFRVVLAPILVP